MNRIKIIFAAIVAVSVVLIGTGAEGSKMKPSFHYKVEANVSTDKPKLNEPITITWKITSDKDIEKVGVRFRSLWGVEVITDIQPVGFQTEEIYTKQYSDHRTNRVLIYKISKGETREFTATIKFVKVPTIYKAIGVSFSIQSSDNKNGWGAGGWGVSYVYVDPVTGLLGDRDDWEKSKNIWVDKNSIICHYDYIDGSFTKESLSEYAGENKRIISMLRKIEPSITDSEALNLHSDRFKIGIPYGYESVWIAKENKWDESKQFKYYLDNGWLKAFRSGGREKWIKEYKSKVQKSWEGKSKSETDSKGVVTFTGQWVYKDHKYSKDQGLLADYDEKYIGTAKAKLLITYIYESTLYRYLAPYSTTDDAGNFTISLFTVPSSATSCKAYPVIYPSGPNPSTPAISISDPNITIPTYWKDKGYADSDSTLYPMQENGLPIPHSFLPSDTNINFGKVWADTFPVYKQPQSGVVNIYETLLHASSFSAPPAKKLRVIWEPNYTNSTGYKFGSDTMHVRGDTIDTDDWDDDHIYHEYGHFLMDCYGVDLVQLNSSNYDSLHQWNIANSAKPTTAWVEGWANYFSGRARVGSGMDSLYVNNSGVIGSLPIVTFAYYYNLENPWDFSSNLGSSFDASEFCEGSVAGILWDIYDQYNENPYPADPTRRDIISRGNDEIWNLMDNYDPYGPPNHIWSIRHFRTGWTQYNYGDESEVTSIYAHHGVLDYLPPTSLNATQPTGTLYAQLGWQPPVSKTSKSYVGYNIYRKSSTDTIYTLVNTEAITDTFYPDYTVAMEGFYNYYVVTTDSFGYESIPSNVASIYINPLQHSNSPLATAYNNASKLVCDTTGVNLHLVYQSNDKIWYTHSTDSGNTWSADTAIGVGQYPAIALDKNEMPNVVWSKKVNIKDCNIYFSKYNSTTGWLNPYILGTFHMPQVTDLVPQVVPGFAIGKADTGFITWLASPDVVNIPLFDITYGGWFSTNDAVPYLNYTALDSVNILAYKCPTVAVDNIGAAHFAWDAKPASYYAIGYRKRDVSGTITPAENISEGGENESPCLNFSRWQNSIDGIWVGPFSPLVSTRSILDTAQNWGLISCVDSSAVQPVVVAGGYAAYSKNNEIYVKRKVGNLWPDSTEKNISNTASSSNYPQACFSQTVGGSNLFVAWTEGDAAPYQIKFAKIAVPAVAKIYADVGGVDLSPYCIQRAGYKIFGTEPYKTVDYHPQRLIYKFGGFNKNKKYSIEMVYYYQDQNEAAEKDAKGGNRKYWMQKLNIDGACKEMTKLISGQRIVVKKPIPPAAYNKDGEVLVYIDKVSGDYAVCAEIFLYEFDKDCEDCNDVKTSQLALSTPIGLPLTTAVYQNAPNPFGQMTNIKYQIAKSGDVSLKVYNIAGQLVKTLANGNHTSGHYSANWDGKDEKGAKAASGIYIYRIQAGEYVNTKKLVILK